MNQSIIRIAAIALLSAAAIPAQGPIHDLGGGFGTASGTGTTNPPDVATLVAREVAFLTNLLTLTTSQQSQATTIFTSELNSITPLKTTISTAQTALTTAIKANDTAGITTQASTIGTTQGQITLIQAKADAAFYALLTSAQQAKLTDFGDVFPGMGPGGLHIPGGGH
jgi:hypothetical protein